MTQGRKGQSYISTSRIVLQNRTWTFPFPESGGICEEIQLNLQELVAWSSGMILALTIQERISERIVALIGVVSVPQNPEQIVESCLFSQERIQQRIGCRLSTFPYHFWWKKSWKRISEVRRLVVGTEIDSPLVIFLISVEVEKFPRASSSSAETTPAGRRRSTSSRREVFDGPLSGQSVYEQTSGVLWHTGSVRGDKVQEQDWVRDIQVRTLRTLADARSNDPVRSQASV